MSGSLQSNTNSAKRGERTTIRFTHAAILVATFFSVSSGDVWPKVSTSGTSVSIENNTNNTWTLGGVRYTNAGFKWTGTDNGYNASWTQILNISRGANNEVNLYFKSNAPADNVARLTPAGPRLFSHTWISNPVGSTPVTGSEYLLMRTGSQGLADNPESEKPITLKELDSISRLPNFYSPTFRPAVYDSLGARGGRYSGGFFDTWLGMTQLQFAYPTSAIRISNTDITMDFKIPFYWMSLGLAQEYLDVDMQHMTAMGMKETFAGTTSFNPAFLTGTEYTPFHVEAPSGLDRALAYPGLFPEYEKRLASARDVGSSGIDMNEFMSYYASAVPKSNTKMNSATTINGTVFSSLFQFVNYDIYSYAQDICWKEGLEESYLNGDPYTGLSAMIVTYNQGMYQHIGNVASKFNTSVDASTLTRNSFGAGNNNYIPDYYALVQKFIDASKNSLTNASIPLLDFPITRAMMLAVYFGDNGTVAKQGDGGILRFMHVGNTAMRQLIWDRMNSAFDILKGRAPGVGAEEVSFRYDFLPLLRTVKKEVVFNRSFRVAGDAQAHVQNYSKVGGCSGAALDDTYPYISTKSTYSLATQEFVVEVTGTDEQAIKNSQWTIDYGWGTWNDAVQTKGTTKGEVSFEIRVPKAVVETYRALPDGQSGNKMWIMVTDSAGNSTVTKIPVDLKEPIVLDSAKALDTDGNGIADRIEAQFNKEVAEFTRIDYSWPAKTVITTTTVTKEDSNKRFVISNISLTGGAANGASFAVVDAVDDGVKRLISGDILDRVGPAASFASLSIANKTRSEDTLKLVVTEKLKTLDKSGFSYLKFKNSTNIETTIESKAVVPGNGDTLLFIFDVAKGVASQGFVRLLDIDEIQDVVGNKPAGNSVYVPLNAIGGREPLFKSAAVYDKNGDGLADSGSVAVTLGGATNKFLMGDASSKQESWPTDNALTNMVSFKTLGDDRATFVPANTSGSGKGKVELKFDNGKLVVPGDLIDSVGPVILKAPTPTYTLPVSGAADQNFHFELTFSEKVAALSDGKTYFEFAADTTTAGTKKAITTAANKSGNSYDFTFDSDALKGFRFVRIIPNDELTDDAKISAQTNNQWVEFTRKDPNTTPTIVNAAVSYQGSTKATGKGDRLTIRFKLATGDEKLIGTDLEKVEWNWDGSSGNAIKGKFGVQTSNDTVTISVPDVDLSGKGIGNGSLTFIKNGKTEMVPFGAIIDSVGPAILDATCYRGQNGSSRDTLELTLSEPITSGTSGDYLFRYAGKEFGPKNVLAITNLNGTSVTYRMETAANEIRANDWINLADKGISDAVNNAPNPLNQKVPVTIRGSKVPAITAAAMFDKDGDGTADSIKIDLLLGSDQDRFVASNQTKSEYSWPSTSPLTATSDVTVLDDTTIVLKGMNIAETFGSGLVKLSFPENGSVEDKLIDKVGPVLTKARLYERTGSGDDTLLVEFSEDVKNLADAKKLLNINNSDVASKTAVSKLGKLWILTFENSHNIRVGQMANIVASSEIRDQNENPAHGNNRKIAIELLKRAVNVMESESGYFDTNPNGTVDLLTVKLAKGVAKERAAEFKATVKWPSKTGLSSIADLALTATISGDTSDLIHFAIDENAVMNGMTYVDAATFGEVQLTQPDDLLGEVTTTFTGKDFMAPVLINTAEYRGIELTENLPEFKDTLKLTFSENIKPFSPEMIETKIFNLKFRKNGGLGSVKLVNNCTFDGATLVAPVLVKSDSKEIPAPGDSIQIAGDLTIADNQGNKQDTLTPFVPFALVHLPVKYELTVYPQPFTVNERKENELLTLYELEGFGKLAIMVRPFGDRAGETLSGTITLFDAVGNQVVSNEEMLFQKGALVYVSDGTNQKGRALGTGVYHGVIVTTSKSGDSVQKNEIVVKVGIKSDRKK